MKNQRLFALLSITVIFVFITSLFSTVNVLADDSTPPAPTEEPVQPPTEVPVSETESAPTSIPETDVTSTPEADPTSMPEVDPTETPEVDTPAEIIESAPEGVDVVVLDENGEAMSLIIEEAAQIIMIGDPMWCPDGDTPGTDALDFIIECTPSYASFGDLITELETNSLVYTGSGTIYVAYNYNATTAGDAGSDIIFDYSNVALTDLVVQGGWNFATDSVFGTSTIDLGAGNSVEFWDWGGYGVPGSLTLQDIIISNGDGLYIGDDSDLTTADVTLVNVDVIGTDGGTYIGTDGDVIISNSKFNDTVDNDGLVVEYAENITLTEVIATGNYGSGAILDNSCGCVVGNIFISSSIFDLNGSSEYDRGLIAHSNGDITLVDVSASGNSGGGAELINCFFDFFDLTGCFNTNPATITISGTNVFNNNGYIPPQFLGSGPYGSVGLWVGSNNGVSLSGVTAQENGVGDVGGGALIFTENGDLLMNNSDFSENCMYCGLGFGFVALNLGGDITLNEVTANGTGNQAFIDAPYAGVGGIILNMSGSTTINNSDFSNNCTLDDCSGAGVLILSAGDVTLDHVTANGNGTDFGGGGGASISTDGDVDIYCSTFNNNSGIGLQADTSGSIILNGVTISGNAFQDIELTGSGKLIVNPFDCNPVGGKKNLSGLPLNIVNTESGQSVDLDCTNFRGTELILPNGDHAVFPCPLQDTGILKTVTNDSLPGKLPDNNTFGSGLVTQLIKDGVEQTTVDTAIIVSFKIPEDLKDAKLAILFWDGAKWVEVDGFATGDGQFQAAVNFTGTFVLVSK